MAVDVLTNRYDNGRAGANGAETELTPARTGVNTFGKLFTRTVDGDLYAQPLIVSGLWFEGGWRNVVFLATSRNWVYAYDADDPVAHVPLWTRQLGPPVPRTAISPGYANFGGEIGITGTPVVDRTSDGGTLFVAAKTYRPGRGDAGFEYRLHALDIVSGEDRSRPVLIEAAVKDRPALHFSPFHNLNRPGLLLHDGIVYLAFGSHDDEGDYYGWILAYEAATLRLVGAYNTAPDLGEGGVWQSGTGLAADRDGFVYAVVGNGKAWAADARPPATVDTPGYGNSLLKLRLDRGTGTLELVDWYTASDVFELNRRDEDLIGGPVLFETGSPRGKPRKYLLGGGKDGKFYLANRNRLGHWRADGNNILQAERVCEFHIHGAPVVWGHSNRDITAFVWSEQDNVKALHLLDDRFGPEPYAKSLYGLPRDELRMPGGVLSLSWNGRDPETAILWAAHPTRENAMNKTVAGTLRAFKAHVVPGAGGGPAVIPELWTSDQDASGSDRLGMLAKFSPPVVANGKVYVGTFSRELVVYGLLKNGRPARDPPEYGMFEFRDVGPDVLKEGGYAGGRYTLRLSGKGLSPNADGAPDPAEADAVKAAEGFLFANLQRNTATGVITITAVLHGINAPDYPDGQAGLMLRRDVQPGDGRFQCSVGFAAIVVDQPSDGQGITARLALRDHVLVGEPPQMLEPVRVEGVTPELSFPVRLRLTARPADGRTGWLDVMAEVASPKDTPFGVLGRATVRFDVLDDIEVNVGLVATARRSDPVREDAAPAYAHFSGVKVA